MEKKIAKNVSSGAEKVESVASPSPARKKSSSTKKASSPAKSKADRVKKEKQEAEKRVEVAMDKAHKKEQHLFKKAELKQQKLEKKAALKEKKLEHKAELQKRKAERKAEAQTRKAERLERKAEHKAEKLARRELLKNESKEERLARKERESRERRALKEQKIEAAKKAREQKHKAREAAHARKAELKKHKREQKTERRRTPGFGGWLAATVSLGVVTLALSTVVMAGYFRMNGMTMASENTFRADLYEMVSISEDMDENLGKLRVSSGREDERKLLTEVLVDSALLESAVERCPVDAATSTDISAFINKTNAYARSLLSQIASGKPLTQSERDTISYLYEVNTALYSELNDLATHMTEKEMLAFMGGKQGTVSDQFGQMRKTATSKPQTAVDAPFAEEGNVGESRLSALEEISSAKAEQLLKEYLASYRLREVRYTGETLSREVNCYDFVLKDENERELFAQITKNGGKLAFFDTYEHCEEKNFDLETCDKLAREFLSGLGYTEIEAVWESDSGMVADLSYVALQNGVRLYPDQIRVRVCESRGRVVGMDASGYLLNHAERTLPTVELSEDEASVMLSGELEVQNTHLALIPVGGEEILAYEFACRYGDEQYLVYIDAVTGDEVQVLVVKSSLGGTYLK